jgi:hypothetical protein
VTIAYPMMDIVLLFVVLQALMFGTARQPVHKLLAASLLSMLVGDFIYDLLIQHNSYATGNPVDAGWLSAYVLLAVAAWHPSMERIAAPPTAPAAFDRRRLPRRCPRRLRLPRNSPLLQTSRGPLSTSSCWRDSPSHSSRSSSYACGGSSGGLAGQARVLQEALDSRGALEMKTYGIRPSMTH